MFLCVLKSRRLNLAFFRAALNLAPKYSLGVFHMDFWRFYKNRARSARKRIWVHFHGTRDNILWFGFLKGVHLFLKISSILLFSRPVLFLNVFLSEI